jgi:hypothetical protein
MVVGRWREMYWRRRFRAAAIVNLSATPRVAIAAVWLCVCVGSPLDTQLP